MNGLPLCACILNGIAVFGINILNSVRSSMKQNEVN